MEERIIRADPVEEPLEYQRELLALLGGDDPVDVLAGTAEAVRRHTDGVEHTILTRRPEPEEWSAAEVLGHIWDAEVVYSFRARTILAQPEPELIGYDQDAWTALARSAFPSMLDAFTALRDANLHLAREASDEDWARIGIHGERGRLTYRILTQEIAGHDRAHFKQLEQTLAAVRAMG